MSNILYGVDISHYNKVADIPDNVAFIWQKSSEGKSYTDPTIKAHLTDIAHKWAGNLPIIGFYHYIRADNGNSPEQEANHFIDTVKDHIGKCLLACDVEGGSLKVKNIDKWVTDFLNIVNYKTKARPFLYASAGELGRFNKLAGIYPLWVAHYNARTPRIDNNDWYLQDIMWQYTNKPIDQSLFYGSKEELASYAAV